MLGDLNINLLNFEIHQSTNEYLNIMISNSLLPVITLPTRISSSSATLIDHIFTNIDHLLAGTIITDITDHYCNFLFVKQTQQHHQVNPSHISYRPITDKAIGNFNLFLESADWTDMYMTHDPTWAYHIFIEKYRFLMDKAMPLKLVRFSKYKHKSHPWITKGLLVSLKNKDKLYNNLKRCNSPATVEVLAAKYRKYKNMYNKLIRAAKKQYWSNNFNQSVKDAK